MTIIALRAPDASGLKVTGIEQLDFGASDAPQFPPDSEKSPAFGPMTLALNSSAIGRWFVILRRLASLPPSATLPYARFAGKVVNAAAPVPLKATVRWPLVTLAEIVRVEVRVPIAVGVRWIVIVQLVPGATPPVGLQVVAPTENSELEEAIPLMNSCTLPEFLTGRVFDTLVKSAAAPTWNEFATTIRVVGVAVGVDVGVAVEVRDAVAVAVSVAVVDAV